MIDATLARFLEEGLGIHIGTRNAQLEPSGARALAVNVDEQTGTLSLYVASVAVPRILADLEANGQAAIAFARPTDDRACQVKGRFVGIRQATPDERPFVAAQWQRFLDNLERIGIARAGLSAWVTWPAMVITIAATDVFNQTPGADAAAPIA
jgi:hypothetical protein